MQQLRDELGGRHGWKTRVAEMLGTTQPWVTYVERGEREAGRDAIAKARQRLRIRGEFFTDEALGDAPRYRDFVGADADLDRDQSRGYPEIDGYLADMERAGTPVAPDHAQKLRMWRRALGPVEREEIVGYHRGMIAADARKALERPIDERARVDEGRGQRKLTPIKKGR